MDRDLIQRGRRSAESVFRDDREKFRLTLRVLVFIISPALLFLRRFERRCQPGRVGEPNMLLATYRAFGRASRGLHRTKVDLADFNGG